MVLRTQNFYGVSLCALGALFWAALTLMMAHALSPNTDHQHGRGKPGFHVRDHSSRPFPSVLQPEVITILKTHKHTSKQPRSGSAKTTMRASTSLLDSEQQELQIATELRKRIEAGFRYKHHNNNEAQHDGYAIDDSDFENCHAVFVGYRFTVEERDRLRSAHVDDYLAP